MKKVAIPLLIVIGALVVAVVIIRSRPEALPQTPETRVPAVRFIQVQPGDVPMSVTSQGQVEARTATELTAEVGGRVVSVSPRFVAGGYVEAGEEMLALDSREYSYAVKQAELGVAEAELALQTEVQQGEIAVEEWAKVNGDTPPPSLVAREPQRARAEAALEAAKARLAQAQLNLERTSIRAPYRARVRTTFADLGQFVTPGLRLASVYAVDYAEIRVALADEELAFLDVPYASRGDAPKASAPRAAVSATFAGDKRTWTGWLSRLEAQVDQATRMVYAVVRVDNPDDPTRSQGKPPLTPGMFVTVEIQGRVFQDVFALPRVALRQDNQVAVVGDDNRLAFKQVDVLRRGIDLVYVTSGLSAEDRICISPLDQASDGLEVDPVPAQEEDVPR